jgi:transposase-like protein
MDKFTVDTDEFKEDETPLWLLKQQEDAKYAEDKANKNEKIAYKEGDQVGNFLFVRYIRFKNRAMFRCTECNKQFQYNIYSIKNKKRCKWYKFHKSDKPT